jgi:secretion/DNA translocation related TadE-like protein
MTAFVIAGVVVVALAGLAVAGYLVADHRARAAADLSALAGAQAGLRPGAVEAAACAAADDLAAVHGGHVEDCRLVSYNGLVAFGVTVVMPVPWPMAGLPTEVRAAAAAGNTDP